MEEIFDIVDEDGNPIGKTIERTKAHEVGSRHRTAHIWVIRKYNGKYQVLLQKRASNKDSFPNRLDTSSAGHIQAGDEPLESAIRELGEELGIKAKKEELKFIGKFTNKYEKEFYGKMFRDNEISFVFVYEKDLDAKSLKIQTEELESVDWYYFDETLEECKKHNKMYCIPMGGLEILGSYLDSLN